MDRKMFGMTEFYKDAACTNPVTDGRTARQPERDDCQDPLTMVFINMQPLDSVYPPCESFCNGTLFPNLNKPLTGGTRQ